MKVSHRQTYLRRHLRRHVIISLSTTMMNDTQDVYSLKFFLLICLVFNLSSAFTFKCPSPYQWNLRADSRCLTSDRYICLFDENENMYKEICRNKAYFDPAGFKLVISGNLDRRECVSSRFQPIRFSTNEESVCMFEKTYCSDEGQIIYDNGSTVSDRQCRCDYTKGYDFSTKPKHGCYCVPSREDCSCYQKPCPTGSIVSPDYQCINLTSWNSQFTCKLIRPFKTKDRHYPSNDNNLAFSAATSERNVRFVLSTVIGVTIILILIMVHMIWFCLPKIESFQDAKTNVVRDNVELKSILEGNVIPKVIRDLQHDIKEKWKTRFSHFVETRAFNALQQKIEEEQCLIISGTHGCGKSSLAFNIALTLEKTFEFDITIISQLDDLFKYASEDKKQIFLIDDVFGKYSVNEYDTMFWNRQCEHIQFVLTRNKDLIILMTSRTPIYHSINIELAKARIYHFNLISEELAFTLEERQKIGKCYVEASIIDELSTEIVMSYSFFPALCSIFSYHEQENVDEYFTLPVVYFQDELENIRKSFDPFYMVLAVLVVCNNHVPKSIFKYNNQEYDEMLRFLSKEIGFGTEPSKSVLFTRFIAFKESFVLEQKSSFECTNINLFETVAFCISPCIMQSILRYGKASFITDKMQLASLGGHCQNCTIMVPASLENSYFKRILFDMKTGLHDIFRGNQHKMVKFRKSYIAYMKTNLKRNDLKRGINKTTVVHLVSAKGYEDYVDFFLKLDNNLVSLQDHLDQTALHKACMRGHMNVAKLLLSYGVDIEKSDINKKTALEIVCDSGKHELVELLLLKNATIRRRSTDFRTVLHDACDNNNVNVVDLLLKKNADVNQEDYHNCTPIILACKKGHKEIIKLLMKSNLEVDLGDKKGRTALYFAVQLNDINVVEGLLKLDANPNKASNEGKVPLYCACEKGMLSIAEMLIKHKALVDCEDKKGFTPLHVACRNSHFEVVQLLLKKGANPNRSTEFQTTSLLIACNNNHIEIVKLLLYYKADVNCKNLAKKTPLHKACINNNKEIVLLLIKHGALINETDKDLQTPLFLACVKGYHNVAAELLKHGASVNKANQNGQTPLHVTCIKGHEETVKMLLNAGANVNQDDNAGITPLHIACDGGSENNVKLLLNAGVDLNMGYRNGSTPLEFVRKIGRKDIESLVLKAVDVNHGDRDRMTPLYIACKEGNEAAVHELLNACVNVNEGDKDGITPLHVACEGGLEEFVTMLINAGVNVNMGDKNGVTPLHIACIRGNEAIVKVFLNSVANIKMLDKNGLTPLEYARKHRHDNIVTMLLNTGAKKRDDMNEITTLHMTDEGKSEVTTTESADVNVDVDVAVDAIDHFNL